MSYHITKSPAGLELGTKMYNKLPAFWNSFCPMYTISTISHNVRAAGDKDYVIVIFLSLPF